LPRIVERRFYHRIYDLNRPGWRAVRRLAEPHRERLSPFFQMDVLAELLPPPDTRILVRNPIGDAFGLKMLLGFMLWSADHLS
jgi:asparagine synthase (glutamine-hydrolysing)